MLTPMRIVCTTPPTRLRPDHSSQPPPAAREGGGGVGSDCRPSPAPRRTITNDGASVPEAFRDLAKSRKPSETQQLPTKNCTKTTRQLSFRGKKTAGSPRPGLAYPRRGLPRITLALKSLPRASKERLG